MNLTLEKLFMKSNNYKKINYFSNFFYAYYETILYYSQYVNNYCTIDI